MLCFLKTAKEADHLFTIIYSKAMASLNILQDYIEILQDLPGASSGWLEVIYESGK
jgi:hypothetical protein